jgi:hypothetical protein
MRYVYLAVVLALLMVTTAMAQDTPPGDQFTQDQPGADCFTQTNVIRNQSHRQPSAKGH